MVAQHGGKFGCKWKMVEKCRITVKNAADEGLDEECMWAIQSYLEVMIDGGD